MMNNQDPETNDVIIHVESWAERNGFAHWAIAILWLILAFVLFQVVASLVLVAYLFITGGITSGAGFQEFLTENTAVLFVANSIGQILFIGLATFVVVKLHTGGEKVKNFLRLNWDSKTLPFIGLGVLLVLSVQPIVIYLGYLNSLLPVPDLFSDLQITQYQMIENFLKSEGILLFALLNIAMVPALCEEVLFRGYVMRAFEKSWGIIASIIISGIVFGMFHIQLGNLLPLASLGIILALMTWLSNSIWPAVIAHFINNGMAVLIGITYPELLFREMTFEILPPIWLLIVSILFTLLLIRVMLNQTLVKK
ncbi:MAG: CPBP family intramembrane metalloprotease [Balneolaceae bacterium]|nr:MAG: CPBP family intramembrane metalloprotease [Balneolaceae bacterium]